MLANQILFQPDFTDRQTGAYQSLGRDDFLSLLVLQLQNQDPLDPIKNEEFVAQMATFSSLEQLISMNDTLTNLSLLQSSINNSQAVNLIGRWIEVQGRALSVSDGSVMPFKVVLDEPAQAVTVKIKDESGATVRTLNYDQLGAGQHTLSFDGKDEMGQPLPDGEYSFTVNAVDENGGDVGVATYSVVHVDGVTFSDGYVYLVAGESKFLLSEVSQVMAGAPSFDSVRMPGGAAESNLKLTGLDQLRTFVVERFGSEASEHKDVEGMKDLSRRVRDALVSAYSNIVLSHPQDDPARHADAFKRTDTGQIIDFVQSVDVAGVLLDKLQWLDVSG